MPDCGQHCSASDWTGNTCVLKPHATGAHVWGSRLCVSGHTVFYVDQETADMYPPCGFGGVLTAEQKTLALEAMRREAERTLERMSNRRRHRIA